MLWARGSPTTRRSTHICREEEGLAYTLANLERLVVKPVGESGGYGITIGPRATRAELEAARAALLADPANWISQPVVSLSVAPTLTDDGLRPRHLDLRPFAVTGRDTWVLEDDESDGASGWRG